MEYFPINLDIRGRNCIIIGGGRVAERKVCGLLECGAHVKVISPELTPGLQELSDNGGIDWVPRLYSGGDLAGAFLVIAATNDSRAQEEIHAEADKHNTLLNVADVPKWCNFILPASVRRGALTVSISTAGKSPALARRLRQDLEKQFGPEYEILLDLLGCLRPLVLDFGKPHSENKIIFEKLLHKDLLVWMQAGRWDRIKEHIRLILGDDVNLAVLAEMEQESMFSERERL